MTTRENARSAVTGEFVSKEEAEQNPDTTVIEASNSAPVALHRRFLLIRKEDPTGISGLGPVAEGIQFSDGNVVLRWLAPYIQATHRERGVKPTTVLHDSTESVLALHGHNGATVIEWVDA